MGILYSIVYDLAEQIDDRIASPETRYYSTWSSLSDVAHDLLTRIDNGVGIPSKEFDDLTSAVRLAHQREQAAEYAVARVIEPIADEYLHIKTLQTRHSDSLDFHTVAVWSVKEALLAAYEAGRQYKSEGGKYRLTV